MKRKIITSIVLLLGLFSLVYILFFQVEFKKTIHLPLPILTVTEQFKNPENLQKWFTPFDIGVSVSLDSSTKKISNGEYQLQTKDQSLYSSLLIYANNKNEKQFIFSALPDTAKNSITSLSVIYKSSYFKNWFGQDDLTKNVLSSFNNFRDYIEDSKRVYGYEIKPVKVVDTLFLFERRTVQQADKRQAMKSIFENLIAYAAKNNMGYTGNRIFYSLKTGDNITLFASIGITREIAIPENASVEVKRMPFEKKLLEATYQGTFGESNKVFAALEKFINDHYLATMGIPYQKFISDGYDFADDQVVQMKVYYPIL
jgi:effector-binding domain-containing protein